MRQERGEPRQFHEIFGGGGGSWNYGDYFVHTFHKLTETPRDTQPCLSDPDILKKAIANVRAVLKANPDMTIISVSQNDGNFDYCKCEKCAAIDAEEGSQAERSFVS